MIAAVAAVLAAAIIAVLGWRIHRGTPTRLQRELTGAALRDAMHRVSELPTWSGEPPTWSDEEIDRLRQIMRKDGEER